MSLYCLFGRPVSTGRLCLGLPYSVHEPSYTATFVRPFVANANARTDAETPASIDG